MAEIVILEKTPNLPEDLEEKERYKTLEMTPWQIGFSYRRKKYVMFLTISNSLMNDKNFDQDAYFKSKAQRLLKENKWLR